MKTEKLIYLLVGLFLGFITAYFICCKPSNDDSKEITRQKCCEKFKDSSICKTTGIEINYPAISIDSASVYFLRYVEESLPQGERNPAVGYTIPTSDLQQALQKANADLNNPYLAVRFYPGIDGNDNKIGMLIGLKLNGNEYKEDPNYIFKIASLSGINAMIGPCPRWCQLTKRVIRN